MEREQTCRGGEEAVRKGSLEKLEFVEQELTLQSTGRTSSSLGKFQVCF